MRGVLACLVLSISLFSCKNKSDKENEPDDIAINRLITEYNTAVQKKDWPSVLNLVHPAIFKYMSKKDFEKVMERTFNGDGYEMRIRETKVDSIYPAIKHESEKYSLVRMKVTILLLLTGGSDSTDFTNERLVKVCEVLEEEYGEDFISCEPNSGGIEITAKDICYGVYLPGKKKWFILSKDEESEEMFNKIIPKEVRNKLEY